MFEGKLQRLLIVMSCRCLIGRATCRFALCQITHNGGCVRLMPDILAIPQRLHLQFNGLGILMPCMGNAPQDRKTIEDAPLNPALLRKL